MTDQVSTPGFFTSAFGIYNDSNVFDTEFKAHEDLRRNDGIFDANNDAEYFGFSPRASPTPDDMKPRVQQPAFQPQDLDGMDLSSPGSWGPKNMFVPGPNHIQSPSRTSFAPKDFSLIENIMAKDLDCNAKLQHGQITPPSDGSPPNDIEMSEELDCHQSREAEQNRPPQTTLKAESKTKVTSRRRRSTQAAEPVEEPKISTNRRRKSTTTRSTISDDVENETHEPDEKRSRFLERNRVAASKCRQKKKEWTNNLEHRARELQQNKAQLTVLVGSLREEMLYLKGEVLKHNNCNCETMREYLNREVQSISQQMPHLRHGYPTAPGVQANASNSPNTGSMDIDHSGHPLSHPSTRTTSISGSSLVDDNELKELLTSEILPSH